MLQIFNIKNLILRNCGGGGGIRTPGRREPPPVFKTGTLNHSDTPPNFL